MNETHASPGRSLALAAALCVLLFTAFFIVSAIQAAPAHALTSITKAKMDSICEGTDFKGKSYVKFKASGVTHKKSVTEKSCNGEKSYCMKYSSSGEKTIENPLTFKANSVGTIDGESIGVEVKITKVTVTKVSSKKKVDTEDIVRFACIDNGALTIGTYGYTTDTASKYGLNGDGTGVRMTVEYTVTFTSGEGYILKVADIDQDGEEEKWTGTSGFKDIFVRNGSDMDASNFKATSKAKGSYYKDAYAVSSGRSFSGTYKGGNCSMTMRILIPTFPGNPSKFTKDNVSQIDVGDEMTWCITRKMPTFYKDALATFATTRFYDKLDSKLEFVQSKSRVYLGSKDVTNQGDFACSNNVVTWTAGSNFLSNRSNYQGQEIKLELVTKAVKPGSLTNTANVTFFEPRWIPSPPPIKINATVSYYRDDETTPIYVDKVSDNNELSSAYQVKSAATTAATRENCAGLTDWYLDRECTKKYDPSKNGVVLANYAKDSNGNIVLNLFAKNKVTLSCGITTDSYMKTHPNKSIFTDSLTTSKVTDYSKVLPAPKTCYYGDVVTFKKCSDLWYRHAGAGHLLSCSDGIYAYEDGSGDLLTQVRLTCNSTAYYKWKGGTYDGVLTTS